MSSSKVAPVSSKEGDVAGKVCSKRKSRLTTAPVRKKSDTNIGAPLQEPCRIKSPKVWGLSTLPPPRRGYSDGNVVPRNAATSTSTEAQGSGRKSGNSRKRVVDIGQKTLRQMNELSKYVNVSGPCAICRNPGAVITMTQIRRRKKKIKRQMSKVAESNRASSPFLSVATSPSTESSKQRRKSVTWTGHRVSEILPAVEEVPLPGAVELRRQSSPEMVSQETGAFLLLISIVALVAGIVVIVKSTENCFREYLGMTSPVSSDAASNKDLGRLVSSEMDTDDQDDTTILTAIDPTVEEAAATTIQRWYRRCHGSAPSDVQEEAAKKKRLDRWTENLRGFFSKKKLNYFKGIPRLWSKKRGGTDRSPQPATEEPPQAIQAAPSVNEDVGCATSREHSDKKLGTAVSTPSLAKTSESSYRQNAGSDSKRVIDDFNARHCGSKSQIWPHRTRSLL